MSSGVTRPSTLGGTISVTNSAALAAMDVTGLPVGTVVWNIDVGAFFKLTASDRTEITIGDTDGYTSPQWTFADAVFTGFEDCTLLVSLAPPNEAFGGTYTIDTVDDPTIVTVTPAPDGATTAPIVGGVTLFDDALATDSVVAVAGVIGVRWVLVSAAGGAVESVTGETVNAVNNTDPTNPILRNSTTLVSGTMSAADKSFIPRVGTNLADADVTFAPMTLQIGARILPPGTLTQNRVATTQATNGVTADSFVYICQDLSAFTYTMKNAAGSTLFTHGPNATKAKAYTVYFSAGDWVVSQAWYVA